MVMAANQNTSFLIHIENSFQMIAHYVHTIKRLIIVNIRNQSLQKYFHYGKSY